MNKTVWDLIQAFGSAATTVGVFLAWFSLRRSYKQARTDFEDRFSQEYRQLSQTLPVKAFLGEPLTDPEAKEAQHAFFRYFDLCNEQVFLRQNRRISKQTWLSWCSGIKSNLQLPAFSSAWDFFRSRTHSFAELQRLENEDFKIDPVGWGPGHLEEDQRSTKPPASPTLLSDAA